MTESRRVQWVDAARGMAIALVVLHHASKRSVVAGSADWWLDVTNMLQTVRMPLFFAVAGVFAASWVSEQRSWASMLRSKVLLFGWVYAVWVLVRFSWFLLVPTPGQDAGSPGDVALRLVQPEGAGWFIVALALMFVVAKAVHGAPPALVVGGASLVSIAFLAGWVHAGNAIWDGLGAYTAFFLLGVTLREQVLAVAGRTPAWVTAAVPVVWAVAYLALATADLETAPVVGFVLRLAGVAAGVAVALRLQHWAWLRALGRGTLPVYLAHQLLVISLVAWLSAAFAFGDHVVLAVGAPLVLAAGLLAVTYPLGRLAPRLGLAWLFTTPRWLERAAGAPAPATAPARQLDRVPA